MSLHGDIRLFWRFASVLRFGSARGLPRCVLDEARDEIASIARHTLSAELRSQCEVLLDAYNQQWAQDLTVVPFWFDLPPQTGCACPACGAQITSDSKGASVRFFAG